MIKFIIHRLKRKTKEEALSPAELVEQKALERVMLQAQEKVRREICQDCRDRRCLVGEECMEFNLRSQAYVWEMIARSAELN